MSASPREPHSPLEQPEQESAEGMLTVVERPCGEEGAISAKCCCAWLMKHGTHSPWRKQMLELGPKQQWTSQASGGLGKAEGQ